MPEALYNSSHACSAKGKRHIKTVVPGSGGTALFTGPTEYYKVAKKDVARPSRPDEVVKNGNLKIERSPSRCGLHSFRQKKYPGGGHRPVAQCH